MSRNQESDSKMLKFTGTVAICVSLDSGDSEIPNKIHGDS